MSAASTEPTRRSWRHADVLLVGALLAGSAAAQLQWEERRVFGRFSEQIAFDVSRGRLVLFAGGQSVPAASETWEWDGSAWQLRSPAQSPPPRSGHALAYDLARGRTVLFGGSGPS